MPTWLKIILVFPLAGGVGLLTPLIIGKDLGLQSDMQVTCGLGVGFLTAVVALMVLLMRVSGGSSGFVPGLILLVTGAACLGGTLLLQVYNAYLSASSHHDRTQQLARLIEEGIQKQGVGSNFNLNFNVPDWTPPGSIVAISWFILFAAVWLITAGVRISLGSRATSAQELPPFAEAAYSK
jgi:hypothetical protein